MKNPTTKLARKVRTSAATVTGRVAATRIGPRPDLKRILVVDDEPIVRLALRETLRHQGYDVVAVEDSTEALQWIRTTPFSVILSDQQLQTQSGIELLMQAKEIQPKSVRILITAVLSLNMVIDAINKCEVYRFIMKPWLRDELLMTVRNAAERYEKSWHPDADLPAIRVPEDHAQLVVGGMSKVA